MPTANLPETVIHYLSVLPGSGKTHWIEFSILQWLEAFHADQDPVAQQTRLVIYCAPTYLLLNQVYESLKRRAQDAGLFSETEANRRIYRITDEARNTLRKVSLHREISVAMGSSKIPSPEENGLSSLKPGSVLLITHEAFSNLPSGTPWTSDVTVYFDEMRACAMEPSNIALTGEQVVSLFGPNAVFLDPKLPPEAKGFAQVQALPDAPKLMVEMFKNRAIRSQQSGRTRLDKNALRRLVESSNSPRARVYLRISKDNLQNPTPDILSDLVHVTVPMDMFFGYRRVVLASAWIEESQMFYLLKRDSRVRLVNLLDDDALLNQRMILGARPSRLRERLVKMVIVPLTQEEKPLSRTRMEKGVMMTPSAFSALHEFTEGNSFNLTRDILGDLEAYARTGFQDSSRKPTDIPKSYKQYLNKFVSLALATQQNSTASNPDQIHMRPLSWFIQTAGEILYRFYQTDNPQWKLKPSDDPGKLSLLVFNQPKEGRAQATRGREKGKMWMETVHWKYRDASKSKLTPITSRFQEISSYSHGLNTFKGYNAITFLSALNPTPLMSGFIREYFNSDSAHIPFTRKMKEPFNVSKDMLISACAQSVARTSVRDIDSDNPVIVIVPDLFTANHLKAAFEGYPLVLGDPRRVPGMNYDFRFIWPSTWNAFAGEPGNETNFTVQQREQSQDEKVVNKEERLTSKNIRHKVTRRDTSRSLMRDLRAKRAADPRFKEIDRLSERLKKLTVLNKQSTLTREQVAEFNTTLQRVNSLRAETGSRPAKYQPLPVNAPAPRRSTV
jgi:hypothetical protein